MARVYAQEILQMKAEFLKDENGNIWFFYGRHIHTRMVKNKVQLYHTQTSCVEVTTPQRQVLESELQLYEERVRDSKSMTKMLKYMDGYFTHMKEDIGVG